MDMLSLCNHIKSLSTLFFLSDPLLSFILCIGPYASLFLLLEKKAWVFSVHYHICVTLVTEGVLQKTHSLVSSSLNTAAIPQL